MVTKDAKRGYHRIPGAAIHGTTSVPSLITPSGHNRTPFSDVAV